MLQITATGTLLEDVKKVQMCVRSTGEMVEVYSAFMAVKDAEIYRAVRFFIRRKKEHPTLKRLAKNNRIIVTGKPIIYGQEIQIRADHLSVAKDSKTLLEKIETGE